MLSNVKQNARLISNKVKEYIKGRKEKSELKKKERKFKKELKEYKKKLFKEIKDERLKRKENKREKAREKHVMWGKNEVFIIWGRKFKFFLNV
ncbi:hypothetical protein Glove_493g46 [Diversispora epigaea]|uniref:Uncharacterized protein n=1 Tax=Diversispora epigaea TaxID=1348612 RepID=A0A397GLT1_9GLOM|nr:hypothetical protein Glove_493g46 [Diversispora epigaea]